MSEISMCLRNICKVIHKIIKGCLTLWKRRMLRKLDEAIIFGLGHEVFKYRCSFGLLSYWTSCGRKSNR
jgi:hypothetical protein